MKEEMNNHHKKVFENSKVKHKARSTLCLTVNLRPGRLGLEYYGAGVARDQNVRNIPESPKHIYTIYMDYSISCTCRLFLTQFSTIEISRFNTRFTTVTGCW